MNKERLLALTKEVSPRYLVVLYLVLVVALGLVISSFLLYPQEVRQSEIAAQLQQARQKVTVVETFVLTHPNTEQYLTELQMAITRADRALPPSPDISNFLSQLEKEAKVAGVKLTGVKPAVVTDRAGYRELPVEISIEGNYFATLTFLKRLEDGERFSVPAAFLIQQKQNILATRLNLQIFSYGVTPRTAANPPGTPPPGSPPVKAPGAPQ